MTALGRLGEGDRADFLRRQVKEWLKAGEEFTADKVAGLFGEVENIFLAPEPSILQGYRDHSRCLHLHIILREIVGAPKGCDFCAVVNYAGGDPSGSDASLARFLCGDPRSNREDLALRQIQRSMLVRVVEFIEKPQGVVQRALPSTVRLQALDQCDRLRPHSLDAVGRVFSIEVFAGKDRECGVSRGLVRGIGENQLPREMIETRSDIVNAVPENRRETPRGRFVDDEKHVAKFLVVLKRDSADVTCEVSVALFPESLDVLLCPVEFEANAVQGMRHEVDSA